jgi:hypothetical protein
LPAWPDGTDDDRSSVAPLPFVAGTWSAVTGESKEGADPEGGNDLMGMAFFCKEMSRAEPLDEWGPAAESSLRRGIFETLF